MGPRRRARLPVLGLQAHARTRTPATPVRSVRGRFQSRGADDKKDGRKRRLQEKPFRVFEALLERPGDVVTREELRQRLWPSDTFVDFDNGLNNSVNKLRTALGDAASAPLSVETVGRRGYRFRSERFNPLTSLGRPGQAEPAIDPPAAAGASLLSAPWLRPLS